MIGWITFALLATIGAARVTILTWRFLTVGWRRALAAFGRVLVRLDATSSTNATNAAHASTGAEK